MARVIMGIVPIHECACGWWSGVNSNIQGLAKRGRRDMLSVPSAGPEKQCVYC